jgi:hypothetical protein
MGQPGRLAGTHRQSDPARMQIRLRLAIVLAAGAASGCSFHSTATHWHSRVGIDGRPVYLITTTIYGINLLVMLPLVGDTSTDTVIEHATAEIAGLGNDHVRVVQTANANYWYAIPPLTWLVSPVMGSVSLEYVPSAKALQATADLDRLQAERATVRREQDHSHVIPEAKR